MTENGDGKHGPSWKFWVQILLGIVGTLITVLVGFYVKSVGDSIKDMNGKIHTLHRRISKEAEERKAIRLKVEMIGWKVYGRRYSVIKSFAESKKSSVDASYEKSLNLDVKELRRELRSYSAPAKKSVPAKP